jgi:subtilase family serine protease
MVNIILKPGAEAAAKAVEEHFRGFGFATQYHPYTNSVELHGTYAQAERAEGFTYVAGGARAPYALSSQPRFPASFAGAVLATTFAPGPVMEPQFTPVINAPSTLPVHFGLPGLAPSDYGTLYGFNLFGQIGVNGAGRTVDILACFGYLHGATKGVNDDITIFASDFGLSPAPNITAFYPSGHGATSYSGEPVLDLSRVYGTAPGAAIRIWFAPHCTFNEFTNLFLDIANDQATHPADALTVSYGNPELSLFSCCGSTLFVGADAALSKITNGTNQKVALFASSGDNGDESRHTTPTGSADVLFPASDFYVMAVGGTTVFPKSPTDVTRQAEFAWSGATTSNNGGSGGGISNIFALPPWQTGVPGTASQTYKNLPDLGGLARIASPDGVKGIADTDGRHQRSRADLGRQHRVVAADLQQDCGRHAGQLAGGAVRGSFHIHADHRGRATAVTKPGGAITTSPELACRASMVWSTRASVGTGRQR